ncbi:MAG TPA: DNA mismatch repair protein MutS [Chloroflexota bacterium]|nr:DNA mismatch repair protein MutS [Chloroflexota bacterium]
MAALPAQQSRTAPAQQAYGEVVRRYLELREAHPGVLLLFRVGSFYEIFFDDAELVSNLLGLKLGERPSGGTAGPVPQCGFTHHALDSFLSRLLNHGYRVAVCEEEGESEGREPRRREIVRTLTPGTVTDPKLLREDRPSYLVAVAATDESRSGLAWTDLAGGEFKAGEFALEDVAAEIQRLDPAEILVPNDANLPDDLLARRTVTSVGSSSQAATTLRRAFPSADLADLPRAETAAGLIVGYLEATQATMAGDGLETPQATGADGMRLDAATQRHLEIVETERARSREGSLLGTIDRTCTPMGRRMLRQWLLQPLTDLSKIQVRQRLIGELIAGTQQRDSLIAHLKMVADLERLAGRAAGRTASVDDLRALAAVAEGLPDLATIVRPFQSPFLRALGKARPGLAKFAEQARAILAPPESGDTVLAAASPALTEATQLKREALAWQASYLNRLRRLPGLGKLKVERTGAQGLFLEVPVNTPVPNDWVRRGGLQRVERYTTAELNQHADILAGAEATIALETGALVTTLRELAADIALEARDLAKRLAAVDALLSLAQIASERNWTQPVVTDDLALIIEDGRHPVLETAVPKFQPNDTRLEGQAARDQMIVLTGPNMAGKSTLMRQVALIVLLAQAGSYVPARHAQVGIVDAIFTRIGAGDDLAGGHSTFMLEMLETASVLKGVTDRGLVILDEIGRGTSTHDGMAIAWAVVEHLVRGPVRPRAIAATHYHELAALREVYPQVTLRQAMVEERAEGIVFPHRIEPGAADRSFGIEVARLAGLPPTVLERAREVADAIEPLSAEVARRLGMVTGP